MLIKLLLLLFITLTRDQQKQFMFSLFDGCFHLILSIYTHARTSAEIMTEYQSCGSGKSFNSKHNYRCCIAKKFAVRRKRSSFNDNFNYDFCCKFSLQIGFVFSFMRLFFLLFASTCWNELATGCDDQSWGSEMCKQFKLFAHNEVDDAISFQHEHTTLCSFL